MWEQIIYAGIGGIVWSLGGFFNNKVDKKNNDKKNFDFKKLLKPTIIGLIVGGISGYTGLTGQYDAVLGLPVVTLIVPVIDRICSIIIKMVK